MAAVLESINVFLFDVDEKFPCGQGAMQRQGIVQTNVFFSGQDW
jgi:hypothetical protein